MPKKDQGVSDNRYKVIPRVIVFIFNGKQVLLIKGSPNKRIWPNLYNGVGGHVERGESVLEAARRELQEETGLTIVEDLWLCGTVLVDFDDECGVALYLFKGTYASGKIHHSGEGQVEWVGWENIGRLACVEDLPVLLPLVAKRQKGEGAFSARTYYDESEKLSVVVQPDAGVP